MTAALPPLAAAAGQPINTHFTLWDWAVLAGYLLLTTLIGHALRGRQATLSDFFLAGRKLPWPAVCASIIATEISALTFIGVPGLVFAAGGNFTYLQWAIGSILARFLVGLWFVRAYYEQGIYSPYDFIASRLGPAAKKLTSALFILGAVLGQSVRVLVTALILKTVTPLDMTACILLITAFAVLWTWMGGMTTVIITDAIQFLLFCASGILALLWIINGLPGGWSELWHSANQAGKFQIWNLSTDPDVQFTLWVALLAMPFQNLAAFGTDQLNAQRIFCCRGPREARLAIWCSSFSQLITILMLLVGAGLFAWYQAHPPTVAESAAFASERDLVFPVWITTVLPPGLTGLVLAGAFAAAISSLDSALAALAQTSLSLKLSKDALARTDPSRLITQSRIAVAIWGLVLAAAALLIHFIKTAGQLDLVSLAFGMVAYTYGPLLAIFLLALSGRPVAPRGLLAGVLTSVLLVAAIRPDIYLLLQSASLISQQTAQAARPDISFVWMYPVTCLLCVFCAVLWPLPQAPKSSPNLP